VSRDDTWQAYAIRILVVEDDPADQELLRIAVERNGVQAEIVPVLTGRAALATLDTEPLPDLILLDLRLPDIDGLDLLSRVKQHARWSIIPVIILSGSTERADVERGYAEHAAAYLQKPTTQQGWQQLVRSFTDYWLKVVLLPGS